MLEDRDGSAAYESVKRRANNWIMINSICRAGMEFGTMGNGGDNEDDNGEQEGDSSGETRKGTVQWRLLLVWTVSRQQQCATTVDSGRPVAKSSPEKG